MKYLREFATRSEYNSFIEATDDYPNVCLVNEDGGVAYNPPPPSPLYIEATKGPIRISFGNNYEYSKDNKTWNEGTSSTLLYVNDGEKVLYRSSENTITSSSTGIGRFTISGQGVKIGGNIMSMIYGSDFKDKFEIAEPYKFYRLFASNDTNKNVIADVSELELPATTLSEGCYIGMFHNCRSIVSAPILPATTLASYCYFEMFYDCRSLVDAPELPAATLTEKCYGSMFKKCSSLVNAPAIHPTNVAKNSCLEMFYDCTSLVNAPAILPATTLASYCYKNMFTNCKSLVNAPALPATTLAYECYSYMFANCTSLTAAPELLANVLAGYTYCYDGMFSGCSNLNRIKAMFTTTPGTYYTGNWVEGVAASGTFIKNSAATWENTFGTSAIPEGWTVEYADA